MKLIHLYLIFIAITFTSCKNCIQTNLTAEEEEWFKAYEKGQELIFKSNRGNTDTLTVTEKIEDFTNKDCNSLVGKYQEQFIQVKFSAKKCKNENYCGGELAIYKQVPEKPALLEFKVFGLQYSPIEQNYQLVYEKVRLSNISKTYDTAYVFKDFLNAKNFGDGYLKSFHWDKKDGLIRYQAKDGEIFELVRK